MRKRRKERESWVSVGRVWKVCERDVGGRKCVCVCVCVGGGMWEGGSEEGKWVSVHWIVNLFPVGSYT